jgi:hypothetical protein
MIRLLLTITAAIIVAFWIIILMLDVTNTSGEIHYVPCKEAPYLQCASP